ncbi:MAG: phosphoribosylformylglycinamidine synthase subunit PurQ, partial [Treponema sp.]|nr:phosphoribosylformylglycinamidine synthase subunit PurQ [Treponema sp.]
RIYSVEVLDIEEIKKSAGQLVPSLDKPGRDTPIADFSNSLLDLYRRVKGEARKKAQDEWGIFRANMAALGELGRAGLVTAAYPVQSGGAAVSLALMAFGNNVGVEADAASLPLAGGPDYQGSVLVQLRAEEEPDPAGPQTIRAAAPGSPKTISRRAAAILEKAGRWAVAAYTLDKPVFRIQAEPCFAAEAGHNMAGPGQNAASGKSDESGEAEVPLAVLRRAYESPLAQVYPQTSSGVTVAAENRGPTLVLPTARDTPEDKRQGGEYPAGRLRDKGFALKTRGGAPLAALPVFPGTNCEWDMERAFREAGAGTRLVIFRNRNREDIAASSRELAQAIAGAQILALSGGFSAGDEPDGSGKFIANALRSPAIAEEVTKLLERGGLVLGICNGFQALIKLGLVPYGKIMDAAETMPTLSFNRIGCHVSRMVRTRVMSTRSPWLALEEPGAIHILPVSHGEGRFVIRREEGEDLFRTGQAAFCYADAAGNPTLAEPDNPNGSDFAIEGLCSPDGRVLGKMAHSERRGDFVHINIPGNKRQRIFEAGVAYFR